MPVRLKNGGRPQNWVNKNRCLGSSEKFQEVYLKELHDCLNLVKDISNRATLFKHGGEISQYLRHTMNYHILYRKQCWFGFRHLLKRKLSPGAPSVRKVPLSAFVSKLNN